MITDNCTVCQSVIGKAIILATHDDMKNVYGSDHEGDIVIDTHLVNQNRSTYYVKQS